MDKVNSYERVSMREEQYYIINYEYCNIIR